jgi:hypothetical protein
MTRNNTIMGAAFGLSEDQSLDMQQQMADNRAIQFAQLTPDQQLGVMAYKAGSGVTKGIGGMLGADMRDPELRKASELRQLASQYNTNTAEGLRAFADSLRASDPALALQVSQKAAEMEYQGTRLKQQQQQEALDTEAMLRDKDVQRILKEMPEDATPEQIQRALLPYTGIKGAMALAEQGQQAKAKAQQTDTRTRAVTAVLDGQYKDLSPEVREYVLNDPKAAESFLSASLQGERQKKLAVERAEQKLSALGSGSGSGGNRSRGGDEEGADGVKFTKKQMELSQETYRGAMDGLGVLSDIKTLLGKATGSGAGALMDSAAGFFGKSTEGAKATARLKVLSNKLLMAVPRFSGPQSDKDVQTYKEAAGQLGDPTIPNDIRMEAWDTIKKLLQRTAEVESANLKRGGFNLNEGRDAGRNIDVPSASTGAGNGRGGAGAGNTPRSSFPGGKGIGSFGG